MSWIVLYSEAPAWHAASLKQLRKFNKAHVNMSILEYSVDGRVTLATSIQFSVIELLQGEVIEQQFGEQEVCFRTLDLYTSAVLEASLKPAAKPKQEYRDAMTKMSEVTPTFASSIDLINTVPIWFI